MKLPRDLSGEDLVELLSRLEYVYCQRLKIALFVGWVER